MSICYTAVINLQNIQCKMELYLSHVYTGLAYGTGAVTGFVLAQD